MNADDKKLALRMIPYGLYVLTANDGENVAGATVNWVTQTSFDPPLIAIGLKVGSGALEVSKSANKFALNMLGKGQQGQAFGFFKPATVEDGKLSGEPFTTDVTGAPILSNCPAAVECEVVEIIEKGDHHVVLAQVVNARVHKEIEGRADEAILEMKELGDSVFYGG